MIRGMDRMRSTTTMTSRTRTSPATRKPERLDQERADHHATQTTQSAPHRPGLERKSWRFSVAGLGPEHPYRRQRKSKADQADRQEDGKVTGSWFVVRTAEREFRAAPVQQPCTNGGDHQAEADVDQAGDPLIVSVVGIVGDRMLRIVARGRLDVGLRRLVMTVRSRLGRPRLWPSVVPLVPYRPRCRDYVFKMDMFSGCRKR